MSAPNQQPTPVGGAVPPSQPNPQPTPAGGAVPAATGPAAAAPVVPVPHTQVTAPNGIVYVHGNVAPNLIVDEATNAAFAFGALTPGNANGQGGTTQGNHLFLMSILRNLEFRTTGDRALSLQQYYNRLIGFDLPAGQHNTQYMVASMAQAVGIVMSPRTAECLQCQRKRTGPYATCVVVYGTYQDAGEDKLYLTGACANCFHQKHEKRCSFRIALEAGKGNGGRAGGNAGNDGGDDGAEGGKGGKTEISKGNILKGASAGRTLRPKKPTQVS